jgi:hypothetical protein
MEELMLYPGSGSEAARRDYFAEPYSLKWENRFGFLRLALRYDAEIVFVGAVGIDEMYYQSRREIPPWLLRRFSADRYRGSHLQFGLLGPHLLPTVLPLPVQITHVVSRPFDLGDREAARHSRSALAELQRHIWDQSQSLLTRCTRATHTDSSSARPSRARRRANASAARPLIEEKNRSTGTGALRARVA